MTRPRNRAGCAARAGARDEIVLHERTIFALSSGAGRAGVAVIRISGRDAGAAVRSMTGRAPPPARRAALRALRVPETGEVLDQALVLWFPSPNSVTGEDVAELHVHGGRAVVDGALEVLSAYRGLRLAEAGEFTRRAFDNGRLDLTEVEGLADLIGAETAAQRRMALREMNGELGRLYDGWRERLLTCLARLEAEIDFPDEDLADDIAGQVGIEVSALAQEVAVFLDDRRRGERLREGLYVAIVGAPNVGKSSLMNRLARRDVAIVAATAGTTRDVIEVRLDLAGLPVTIADTAGLRETGDAVEMEGVRRARAQAAMADLTIAVFDATEVSAGGLSWVGTDMSDGETVTVINKTDLASPDTGGSLQCGALRVSARTGEGIEALIESVRVAAAERMAADDGLVLSRPRQRAALEEVKVELRRALTTEAVELRAEALRLGVRALGRVTGRVDVEDILDLIFAEFCIGK